MKINNHPSSIGKGAKFSLLPNRPLNTPSPSQIACFSLSPFFFAKKSSIAQILAFYHQKDPKKAPIFCFHKWYIHNVDSTFHCPQPWYFSSSQVKDRQTEKEGLLRSPLQQMETQPVPNQSTQSVPCCCCWTGSFSCDVAIKFEK